MGHSPCLNLTLVITFSFEVTAWSLCRISTRTHCSILPKWAYILDLRAHIQTLINTPVCLVKFLIFLCYLSFINVSVSSPKTNDVLLSCTCKKMLEVFISFGRQFKTGVGWNIVWGRFVCGKGTHKMTK